MDPQRFSDSCSECPPFGSLFLIVAGLVVSVAIYILYTLTGYEELQPRSTLRIVINHLQVSAIVVSFDLKWPPIFLKIMYFLYDIIAFDIGGKLYTKFVNF